MQQSEIDALKKAAKYSLPPNRLGYCGPVEAWRSLETFLSNPLDQNALYAKELLQQFHAMHPYLELIAKETGLNPFDEEVIDAYWIGNLLLGEVSHEATQKTILGFQGFGLPKTIAEKKANTLPKGMLPHHSMHVLHLNFISPKAKPIVQNLSNCLTQWATVICETKNGLRVKGVELFAGGNELKLREKEKTVKNPFDLELKPKDIVSVHWGSAIEGISASKLKNLKAYTFKNLKAVNNHGSGDADERQSAVQS